MKIYGVGVDIVECARIAHSLERFGERFRNRVFLPDEVAYCEKMKVPTPHFAARFAAKEAISKCFGTGIGKTVGWRDMEIVKKSSGAPVVVLHGGAKELAEELGVLDVLVSLSHTENYGAANAVITVRD